VSPCSHRRRICWTNTIEPMRGNEKGGPGLATLRHVTVPSFASPHARSVWSVRPSKPVWPCRTFYSGTAPPFSMTDAGRAWGSSGRKKTTTYSQEEKYGAPPGPSTVRPEGGGPPPHLSTCVSWGETHGCGLQP
jgi:hypothetical protein